MRNRMIRGIAGGLVLLGLGLGYYIHEYWYFLIAFVGINLFQSSLTKWCMMDIALRKMGVD